MMTEQTVEQVPIGQVKPAPDNPRKKIGDVSEMAASMLSVGVLEPILATRNNGHYEIVAGERRHAAAELAGLKTVPVIVREFTAEERLLAMTVENLQREDLTPVEEADAYQRLLDELKISQRELAPKVGKTQSHISKRVALLGLPKDVQAKVDSGGITIADAVELAKLADHPKELKHALDSSPWQAIEVRVRHELDAIHAEEQAVKLQEEIESKGVATIRCGSTWNLPKGTHRLKGGNAHDPHALQITLKQHEALACHRVAVVKEHGKVHSFPVCVDRKNHPNIKTRQEANRSSGSKGTTSTFKRPRETPEQQKRNERRTARLAFVGELVKKKPPQAALTLVLRHFLLEALEYSDGELERVAIWLGLVEAPEDGGTLLPDDVDVNELIIEFAAKGEAQLQRAAFALAAYAIDDHGRVDRVLEGHSMRGQNLSVSAYLEFLHSQGAPLSDVETKHIDEIKAAA